MGIGDLEPDIHLDGDQVETVDHFNYLGSETESGGRLDTELRSRIRKALCLRATVKVLEIESESQM